MIFSLIFFALQETAAQAKPSIPQKLTAEDLEKLFPQGNPVLAKVEDREILASELAGPFFFHFAPQANELLRKLVNDEIARREAIRLQISVDSVELEEGVRQGIATLRKQIDLEYAGKRSLEKFLEEDLKTSLSNYERSLRRFVLGRLFFERVLRFEQMLEDRVVCRVLTVKDSGKAEEFLAQLREGADFELLAKQNSIAPNRDKGGKMPPFGKDYNHPIAAPAFQAELGALGGPVEEKRGGDSFYHLFRVIEKIPARKGGYSELEPEVKKSLSERPIEEWEYFYWSEKMGKRYHLQNFERP